MDKEQQIEELYGVIDLWATNAVKINKYDGASVYNPYNAKSLAEAIYNAGYRKFNGSNFDYCIYSSDKETVEACVQAPCPVEKRISELRKETAKEILRRMAKFMNEEFCGDDAPCNFNDYDEFIKLIQVDLQNNLSYGVNSSRGVNLSYGIVKCEGISRSLFCYKKSGKLMIFNKKVSEYRFNEVYNDIIRFNWFPKFNNAEELKGNLEWYETNIPAIVSVDNKTAWSFMPENMKEYIQSLPEFNEKLFNKITGDIEE